MPAKESGPDPVAGPGGAGRCLRGLLRHRRAAVAVHAVLLIAAIPGILRLETDNSPEVFFSREAGAQRDYEEFRRDWGSGSAVRAVASGPGLWTTEGLAWLSTLEGRIAREPGVRIAVGPSMLLQWSAPEWPPEDPAVFRAEVLNNSGDLLEGWVSPDAGTVTLPIMLEELPSRMEGVLLGRLESMLAEAPPNVRTMMVGLPILHRAMDRSVVDMAARFLPLLVLMTVCFLAAIFRRPRDVLVPLVLVGFCLGVLFGVMGWAGVNLNLVNIILAPLVFVISLATSVHILVHFRRMRRGGLSKEAAVMATYRDKWRPVLWTGLTTCAAFGSLVTARLPLLGSLGVWCASGIALSTVSAFSLYPALLAAGGRGGGRFPLRPFDRWAGVRGRHWAHWAIRHRKGVFVVTAAVCAVALTGFVRLRVSDNIVTYFPPEHPARSGLEMLQKAGVGLFPAELLISHRNAPKAEGAGETGFRNPGAQERLALLSSRLRAEPLVFGVVSSGDLVEAAIRTLLVEGTVNDRIRWLALGLMQTSPGGRALLGTLLSADGQSARVTLLVPVLSFTEMQPLFERSVAEAARMFPGARIAVTGEYPLIILAQQRLLRGMVSAFAVTFACVAALFLLVLRNGRLVALVLIPNLCPLVLVLGGVGWWGLPVDSATIMTVTVVLGLSVDDTFHTLSYFLERVRRTDPASAIEVSLGRIAPAHMLTSVILVAGFFVCSLSELLPVARFGFLASLALVLALIGDLLLVPALLARAPAGS